MMLNAISLTQLLSFIVCYCRQRSWRGSSPTLTLCHLTAMLTTRSGGIRPGSASYTVTSLDLTHKQQQSMLCLLKKLPENDAGGGGDACSIMYILAQTAVLISVIHQLLCVTNVNLVCSSIQRSKQRGQADIQADIQALFSRASDCMLHALIIRMCVRRASSTHSLTAAAPSCRGTLCSFECISFVLCI
jgi:hypothetical protein